MHTQHATQIIIGKDIHIEATVPQRHVPKPRMVLALK